MCIKTHAQTSTIQKFSRGESPEPHLREGGKSPLVVLCRNKALTAKLLRQGYRYFKLRKTFLKFYRRHIHRQVYEIY